MITATQAFVDKVIVPVARAIDNENPNANQTYIDKYKELKKQIKELEEKTTEPSDDGNASKETESKEDHQKSSKKRKANDSSNDSSDLGQFLALKKLKVNE